MSDSSVPRSDLTGRFGLIAFELALVAVIWYMGLMPHVIAGGLAIIIVVSGLLPERWGPLATGALMLIGAGVMFLVYTLPGDRRIAAAIAVIGLLFTIYGVMRLRTAGGR